MIWRIRQAELDLAERGIIMGVLNVTPDSFFDGARYATPVAAVRRGCELIEEGAGIIDIGGESSRPGALPISAEEELRRILPVVRELRRHSDVFLSIDTYKSEVARCCLEEGADIINDITALQGDPEMGRVVVAAKAGLILMHMQGMPLTMQKKPKYVHVVAEVRDFLRRQAQVALSCGIDPMSIVFDPGIGFGKTATHNLLLLASLEQLTAEGRPVLMGLSRKSFISNLLGDPSLEARFWPGVALTSYCREKGARIFRVHEPRPHSEALRMTEAILL